MFAYACGGCSGLFTVRYLTVVRGATRAGLTTSEREPERTERTHARFCNVIEPERAHMARGVCLRNGTELPSVDTGGFRTVRVRGILTSIPRWVWSRSRRDFDCG